MKIKKKKQIHFQFVLEIDNKFRSTFMRSNRNKMKWDYAEYWLWRKLPWWFKMLANPIYKSIQEGEHDEL